MSKTYDAAPPSNKQAIAAMLCFHDYDPPVGASYTLPDCGQTFTAIAVRDVPREGKAPSRLVMWRAPCAVCQEPFTWESRRSFAYSRRTCAAHANQYKRVAVSKSVKQRQQSSFGAIEQVVLEVVGAMALAQDSARASDIAAIVAPMMPGRIDGKRDTRRQSAMRAIKTLAQRDAPVIRIAGGVVTFAS